jgi:hypothetical protein
MASSHFHHQIDAQSIAMHKNCANRCDSNEWRRHKSETVKTTASKVSKFYNEKQKDNAVDQVFSESGTIRANPGAVQILLREK